MMWKVYCKFCRKFGKKLDEKDRCEDCTKEFKTIFAKGTKLYELAKKELADK